MYGNEVLDAKLAEAKKYLGTHWVLHPQSTFKYKQR